MLNSQFEDHTVCLSLLKETVTLNWIIKDFKSIYDLAKISANEKTFAKMEFTAGKSINKPSNWLFSLEQRNKEDIALFLHRLDDGDAIAVKWQILVRAGNGKFSEHSPLFLKLFNKNACEFCICLLFNESATGIPVWEFLFKTVSQLIKENLLTSDELALRLKVTIYGEKKMKMNFNMNDVSPLLVCSKWEDILVNSLTADFGNLLKTGEGADVTFSVVKVKKAKENDVDGVQETESGDMDGVQQHIKVILKSNFIIFQLSNKKLS